MGRSPRGRHARVVLRLLGRHTLLWFGIAVVAGFTLAAVEVAIAFLLQLFLRSLGLLKADVHVPPVAAISSARMLALALVLIAFVRSCAQFFVGQSATEAMERINARIRRIAIWDMLLHPSKRIVPAAAVNARVGDLAAKASLFCYASAALVGGLVQAIALIGAMIFAAAGETIIALAGLGLLGVVVLRLNRTARNVAGKVPFELRVLTEGIERVARNTSLVRVLRTQAIEHGRLVTSVDKYARYLIHAGQLGNVAMAATPFVGVLLILLIVGTSQRFLHTPGMTLLSFLYLFVRFVQTLSLSTNQLSNCNATWPMFRDCVDYASTFQSGELDAAMKVGEALIGRKVERSHSAGGSPPDIAVRCVGFSYPGGAEVLRAVSLEVEHGAQLAIVGPSGCGKSTLLGLILGLIEPNRGDILIGGRTPAAFFDDPAVRVGYVGADPYLIAGTIRENLRYGIGVSAGDDELWRALALASMDGVVAALPRGLDYLLAEDGSGLSAGQKQRLCLARALVNLPHVLVLDEASANLDEDTEREIAESLRSVRGMCTTILVSHRPGMLRFADRVISLSGGVIEPPRAVS